MQSYQALTSGSSDTPLIQAQLKVGMPGDKYEREADAMANRVMAMPQTDNFIQRKCSSCEEEELQMKSSPSYSLRMQPVEEEEELLQPKLRMQPIEEEEELLQPKLRLQPIEEEEELLQPKLRRQPIEEEEELIQPKLRIQRMEEEEEFIQPKRYHGYSADLNSISSRLNSSKTSGLSLPDTTNQFMSNAFNSDFGKVRIHTNSHAIQMNQQLGAQAFTYGNNIYFNSGNYNPASTDGKKLLAHELTHVVQQKGLQRKSIQRKGECCHDSPEGSEWAIVNSKWKQIDKGDCFGGIIRDCTGMTCGGGFYWVGGKATCRTPRKDSPATKKKRWTPFDPKLPATALSPVARGAGTNTPTSYLYDPPVSEFETTGKHISSNTMSIFFDKDKHTLDTAEKGKIPKIISSAGATNTLTLHGWVSADESDSLATDRIDEVDTALKVSSPPHTGVKNRQDHTASESSSLIQYRERRMVEVAKSTVGSTTPIPTSKIICTPTHNPIISCPAKVFDTALPKADKMIEDALNALNAATLATNTQNLLSELFGGTAQLTDIKTNLTTIRTHLSTNVKPAANHRCADDCEASCSAPAYNTKSGSSAMMTLCSGFYTNLSDVDGNADTLIHEAAHGTTGLTTKDYAYGHTRRIIVLPPAEALKNSDSYTLLVRNLHKSGSAKIGVADVKGSGISDTEFISAKKMVAHLETWLVKSYQDMEDLFSTVARSHPPATNWGTESGDAFNRKLMHLIYKYFVLTDPGTTSPYKLPTETDKHRLAAIAERLKDMRSTMWSTAVTINKVSAGTDAWAAGPNSKVSLSDTFFGISSKLDRVKFLLKLIIAAHPDITAHMVDRYAEAVDIMRKKHKIPDP